MAIATGSSSTAPLGVAFAGAGMVADLHAQALGEIPEARLVGLYRRDDRERRARAAALGVPAYDTYRDLLDDPAVDAVFVLATLEAHRDLALEAISAGKHVLIEKPVGRSIAEVEEIAAAATRQGVVCMPGHNYVYQPELWRARRLIARRELGTICAVFVNYVIFHGEEVARGYPGVLRQILTHHFYTLLFLLGEPARLTAFDSHLHYTDLAAEDQVSVLLQYPDSSVASLFATFAAEDHSSSPWTFFVKILGTRGSFECSWRDAYFERPLGSLPYALPMYEETYVHEDRHFVEMCRGRQPAPLSGMGDAAAAQLMVEAAESAIGDRRVVELAWERRGVAARVPQQESS